MTDEQAIAERAAKATLEELADAWATARGHSMVGAALNSVDKEQNLADAMAARDAFLSHCAALRDEVERVTAQLERLKTAANDCEGRARNAFGKGDPDELLAALDALAQATTDQPRKGG